MMSRAILPIGVVSVIVAVFCLTHGCRYRSMKGGPTVSVISNGKSSFEVVDVDLSVSRLQLFWKKPDGSRFASFASLVEHLGHERRGLLFATNAGIFDANFTPCGLHVEDGHEITRLNLDKGAGNFYLQPNGVFLVDGGSARVVRSGSYPGTNSRTSLATQSGPLLVIDGKVNEALRAESTSTKIRSGVGVVTPQRVIFVLSREPVTFYEFAHLFLHDLHCADAIYLDGSLSRFYLPGAKGDGNLAGIIAVTD